MSATNFNTHNDTYRKLMGNGLIYRVPPFQRDYSWSDEEWDDLWQDILGTLKEGGEPAHYMGYLVLQSADEKCFDIIDGQQRLTTLSLIVLAALRNLKRLHDKGQDIERTRQRLDGLRQTYIGYLDPVTLVAKSKLTLNRNNDDYYQNYIVPLVDPLPQRGFKVSEHSLRKAFEWFSEKIERYVKGEADPGVAIARLVDTMSDRLFFTVITVADELNAYKVFETLNARGVRLSSTDLLKNYLFSVLNRSALHDYELKKLEDRWVALTSRLGSESFPDFLRAHWISRHKFVRKTDLFKEIRGQNLDRGAVFALMNSMEEDMDTYLALTSPDGSGWSVKARDWVTLLKTFRVRQPFPLIMAAKRVLNDADFDVLLRAIVTLSFRYNVIGRQQTNEQERVYHAVAQQISTGERQKVGAILDGLRPIYPGDDAFRGAFAEKSIRTAQANNRRLVRYILCALEKKEAGSDLDYLSDANSIEHICPTNPQSGWDSFSDQQIEELSDRLGNMTLLASGKNRDLGNVGYAEKKPIYANSSFLITRSVAEKYGQWTPQNIIARQRDMARQAVSIWRIDQLA